MEKDEIFTDAIVGIGMYFIDQFINDKENLEKLNGRVTKASDSLFNWLTDIKLRKYLSILSIDKIEGLLSVLEDELNFTLEELKKNAIKNEEVLMKNYRRSNQFYGYKRN